MSSTSLPQCPTSNVGNCVLMAVYQTLAFPVVHQLSNAAFLSFIIYVRSQLVLQNSNLSAKPVNCGSYSNLGAYLALASSFHVCAVGRAWWLGCTPMASAPCHLLDNLELPTAVLLLIADAACHRSVGRPVQASHLCWAQLYADLVTKCFLYDAHMVRKSAWGHAILFGGLCPFQGSRPQCLLRSLWHSYPCNSGRQAPCGALRRHAAPCPAGAHYRICRAPFSLDFNKHTREQESSH